MTASLKGVDLEVGSSPEGSPVVKREATEENPEASARRAEQETAGGGKAFKRTRQIVKPPPRMRVALRKIDNYAVVSRRRNVAGRGLSTRPAIV